MWYSAVFHVSVQYKILKGNLRTIKLQSFIVTLSLEMGVRPDGLFLAVDTKSARHFDELFLGYTKPPCGVHLAGLAPTLVKDVERQTSGHVGALDSAGVDVAYRELVHHVTHQTRGQKPPRSEPVAGAIARRMALTGRDVKSGAIVISPHSCVFHLCAVGESGIVRFVLSPVSVRGWQVVVTAAGPLVLLLCVVAGDPAVGAGADSLNHQAQEKVVFLSGSRSHHLASHPQATLP